jgi:tetratricopeptide (TPR) repeat protein
MAKDADSTCEVRLWGLSIAVIVAASAVLGFLVYCAWGEHRSGSAQQLYLKGRGEFEARRWQAAIVDWQAAVRTNATSLRSRKARKLSSQYLLLAEAELAVQEHRWDEAREHLRRAGTAGLPNANTTPTHERLAAGQRIQALQLQFEDLIRQGRFDRARPVIDLLDQLDPLHREVRRDQVTSARRNMDYEQLLRGARRSIASADYRSAVESLRKSLLIIDTPKVRTQLRSVLAQQAVDELVSEAGLANQHKDYSTAAVLLDQALQLGGPPELEEQLAEYRARALLQQADQLQAVGQLDRAVELLYESLRHRELSESKESIAHIKSLMERKQLLTQADDAFAAERWQTALTAYERAVGIKPSEFAESRIRHCRYRLSLAAGDGFARDRRWEEAFAAYQDAASLGPEGTPKERMAEVLRQRDYHRKLADADAYLEAGHFDLAHRLLKEASRSHSGKDLDDRFNELGYQRYMAESRAAAAAGNYRLAMDHANSARRHKSTQELELLVSSLRDRASSQPAR